MEFKKFFIEGLFGLYDHTIEFTSSKTPNQRASIIMLFGQNGIGKTTILRMIEGIMDLNFDKFREVKFHYAKLEFSNNQFISVQGSYSKNNKLEFLEVKFDKISVKLHPEKKGALNKGEEKNQDDLITYFGKNLDGFSFEFIDTERLMEKSIKEREEIQRNENLYQKESKIHSRRIQQEATLKTKIIKFITESQVYNSRFFSKDEPELFDRIINSIENPKTIEIKQIKQRINSIVKSEKDFQTKRLGIAQERWDKQKFIEILNIEQKKKNPDSYKLTVINSYLEVLESRLNERISLAERLLTFEEILNDFLIDKTIVISKDKGFEIKSTNGDIIPEFKLSTGEYHLLYLTTLALCTTVVGTVIAIDEPEMSMHISWQNKLINALMKISLKANPQFIFATHSPDIAANYSNSLKTEKYARKN